MDFLFSFSLVLSHLSSFISYLNNFSNLLSFEKLDKKTGSLEELSHAKTPYSVISMIDLRTGGSVV